MRLSSMCLLLVVAILLSACSAPRTGSQSQAPATPAASREKGATFPLTITDDAGRSVTVPAPPRRLVSLAASITETLYALDLEDKIVGVDQYSDFPPSTREKPKVGSYLKPDLEKVLTLDPDLLFGTGVHVKATLPELERRGLRVVIVDPRNVEEVLERIRLVGDITGQRRQAEALTEGLRARVKSVEARVKGLTPVRVFYELSPQLHSAGPGSFIQDVLQMAGGANIAADAGKEWPQLNQEALLLLDPEVIILADHSAGETPERVAVRPGWQGISAVKNGRVVVVDPNAMNRPGPRVVDGLELVAKILHPYK